MELKTFALTALCCIVACTAQKKITSSMDELVKKSLGSDEYLTTPNATEEYALCYVENKTQINIMSSIRFAVYSKESNSIVYSGTIRDGYIKWINDYELEQFDPPGLAEEDKTAADYKKVINIKTYIK
jgi:hydroxymethylpyrimidine/phosphomethylpyrimidine kinase